MPSSMCAETSSFCDKCYAARGEGDVGGAYLGADGYVDGSKAVSGAAFLHSVYAVGHPGVGLAPHVEDRNTNVRAGGKLNADGLFLHTRELKHGDDFIAGGFNP